MSVSPEHRAGVAQLVAEGWCTSPALKRAVLARPELDELLREQLRDEWPGTVWPDAYRFLEEDGLLVLEIAEVEVTHPVSVTMKEKYRNLWWALDSAYIDLHVYAYRQGHPRREVDLDVLASEEEMSLTKED